MKKPRSFRIDEDLLKRCDELGLDKTKIIEAALAKAIGDNKCPFCGGKFRKATGAPKVSL